MYFLKVIEDIAVLYAPFAIPLAATLALCAWATKRGLMREEE